MKAIAANEMTYEQALELARKKPSAAKSKAPHDLVVLSEVTTILGIALATASNRSVQRDFPTPVLVKRHRYWLREDIEAFNAKRPVATRTLNELGETYVNRREVAAILGVSPLSVDAIKQGRPDAVLNWCECLWLRSEIEAFRLQRLARSHRARTPNSRRDRAEKKRAARSAKTSRKR